jgi:hypothetical protein
MRTHHGESPEPEYTVQGGEDHSVGCLQSQRRTAKTFRACGHLIKRILGVFVFPALVMAGLARVAPNPDGVLLLALVCAFTSSYYLKP